MVRESAMPLLRRDWEMTALQDLYDQAKSGIGSVALVIGEAGIGKTRLINEFTDWVLSNGAALFYSTCYEGAISVPFGPWVEAIRTYFASESQEEIRQQLTDVSGEIADLIPELRSLLPERASREIIAPADARARLFSAIVRIISTIAAYKPIIIAFDNLQWADRESLGVFLQAATALNRSAAVFVGTFRESALSESASLSRILPDLAKLRRFTRIYPRELGVEEVEDYVRRATEGLAIDVDSVEIHERSQGNPFYLQEFVREAVARMDGSRSKRSLPRTIRETIRSHIELTPTRTQETLRLGAVVGRSFTLSDLAILVPDITRAELLDQIEPAKEFGIIDTDDSSNKLYRFTHVLFQEFLENTVPGSEKTLLHKTYGLKLLKTLEDRNGSEIMIAFRHLSRAAATEKITELPDITFQAASYAFDSRALEEALATANAGLAVRDHRAAANEVWAQVLKLKGRILFELRDPRGRECLIQAFDMFEQLGNRDEAFECAFAPYAVPAKLGGKEYWQIIMLGIPELLPRALPFVAPRSFGEKLLLLYGRTMEDIIRISDAEEFLEDVVEDTGFDTRLFELHVRFRFAMSHFWNGKLEKYRKQEKKAIELADRVEDEFLRRQLNFFRFRHTVILGNLGDARIAAESSRQIAEVTQSRETLSSAFYLAAHANYFSGAWNASARNAQNCIDLRHGSPRSMYNEYCIAILMAIAYEKGDSIAGDDYKSRLLAIGGDSRTPYAFLAPLLTRLTGKIDDPDRLRADLEAISSPRDPKYKFPVMDKQVALAQYALWCSDLES